MTDERAEKLAREVWAQVGPNEIAEAEAFLAAVDADPETYGYTRLNPAEQLLRDIFQDTP